MTLPEISFGWFWVVCDIGYTIAIIGNPKQYNLLEFLGMVFWGLAAFGFFYGGILATILYIIYEIIGGF